MSTQAIKIPSIKFVEPTFQSRLTDLILELDRLRTFRLDNLHDTDTFDEIKQIFLMLESIGSARIEGNRTTVLQYVEQKIDSSSQNRFSESIEEIVNVEKTMQFIDENIKLIRIDAALIRELHRFTVSGLSPEHEGDRTPGQYRLEDVKIGQLMPPNSGDVPALVQELVDWLNVPCKPKHDLLKIAIAHHRFVLIHPFANGNGRTARLFTYAMLIKAFLCPDILRILNPTAIFCADRNRYYEMLAIADNGEDDDILSWCEYVLDGLKQEIDKIERLLDAQFMKKEILFPAVQIALKNRCIDVDDARILELSVEKKWIQKSDLRELFPSKSDSTISRKLSDLKSVRLLKGESETSRKYHIRFRDNILLPCVIERLVLHGFVPKAIV